MALNGLNLVYAQTAAEFPWIKVCNLLLVFYSFLFMNL